MAEPLSTDKIRSSRPAETGSAPRVTRTSPRSRPGCRRSRRIALGADIHKLIESIPALGCRLGRGGDAHPPAAAAKRWGARGGAGRGDPQARHPSAGSRTPGWSPIARGTGPSSAGGPGKPLASKSARGACASRGCSAHHHPTTPRRTRCSSADGARAWAPTRWRRRSSQGGCGVHGRAARPPGLSIRVLHIPRHTAAGQAAYW